MKQLLMFWLAINALTVPAAEFRLLDIPQNKLIGGSDLIAVRAVIYVSPVSPDVPSNMTFRAISIASPWVNAGIGAAPAP